MCVFFFFFFLRIRKNYTLEIRLSWWELWGQGVYLSRGKLRHILLAEEVCTWFLFSGVLSQVKPRVWFAKCGRGLREETCSFQWMGHSTAVISPGGWSRFMKEGELSDGWLASLWARLPPTWPSEEKSFIGWTGWVHRPGCECMLLALQTHSPLTGGVRGTPSDQSKNVNPH